MKRGGTVPRRPSCFAVIVLPTHETHVQWTALGRDTQGGAQGSEKAAYLTRFSFATMSAGSVGGGGASGGGGPQALSASTELAWALLIGDGVCSECDGLRCDERTRRCSREPTLEPESKFARRRALGVHPPHRTAGRATRVRLELSSLRVHPPIRSLAPSPTPSLVAAASAPSFFPAHGAFPGLHVHLAQGRTDGDEIV